MPEQARVLIVEDDPDQRFLLTELVREHGHLVEAVSTGRDGIERVVGGDQPVPHVVLVDLGLPDIDGVEVIRSINTTDVPVIVVSASVDLDRVRTAMESGAESYLHKPIDVGELTIAIENVLRRATWRRLDRRTFDELRAAITTSNENALEHLSRVAARRDDETGDHTQRVGFLAGRLARAAGVDAIVTRHIELGAPMHDIGKVALSDDLLFSDRTFSDADRLAMRSHVIHGWEILKDEDNPVLATAAEIARGHHERVDGRGYPDGLTGSAIPLAARITSIVDVYDALTHRRRYRDPIDAEDVEEALRADPGHLDQDLVTLFLEGVLHHPDPVVDLAAERHVHAEDPSNH